MPKQRFAEIPMGEASICVKLRRRCGCDRRKDRGAECRRRLLSQAIGFPQPILANHLSALLAFSRIFLAFARTESFVVSEPENTLTSPCGGCRRQYCIVRCLIRCATSSATANPPPNSKSSTGLSLHTVRYPKSIQFRCTRRGHRSCLATAAGGPARSVMLRS